MERQHFISLHFRNYKALKNYTLTLRDFNILVGPNNSGKSTILGAFRILSEGMRKAAVRKPELVRINREETWAYRVSLKDLPISTENLFSNYDDSEPATIDFKLSNGNVLQLRFPELDSCYLVCRTKGRPVRTTADFRREYNASIGFVPILGPVEHDEPLYQIEAAQRALMTHRASRNFRNIWHHYREDFEEFRNAIRSTWPGMDILPPEVNRIERKSYLRMFCPEERFPREIYWAGFGFQVWCQMLTFILKARDDSLLVIDEPDIYLHSDLQRQLIGMLKEMDSDILIATHSTEIISEADPGDIIVINKKNISAKRIADPAQLQSIFSTLGSNLNPTLTQLTKTKRAVFVEGRDFQILSAFARKLSKKAVANRADFAVIAVDGFNPARVRDLADGMEMTLGGKILRAVIFDRDYRSEAEVSEVETKLESFSSLAHIHRRKELENYLLDASAIDRVIKRQVQEHNKRAEKKVDWTGKVQDVLEELSRAMKGKVRAQFLAKRSEQEKAKHRDHDHATINERLLEEFDNRWDSWNSRIELLPGKEMLADLNSYLQRECHISVTTLGIVAAMDAETVPREIVQLIDGLEKFRTIKID